MITAKPTKNLTGVVCAVTLDDAQALNMAIERMSGTFFEDFEDKYWAIKMRLRKMVYDILENVETLDNAIFYKNGVTRDMMKHASRIVPQENVFYTFHIFMPEAMLLGMAMHEMTENCQRSYEDQSFAQYYYDKAVLELFGATLLSAVENVLRQSELDDLYIQLRGTGEPLFADYLGQFIDHCNVSYLDMPLSLRRHMLSKMIEELIARRGIYTEMEKALTSYAGHVGRSVHELYDANLKYPDDIEW